MSRLLCVISSIFFFTTFAHAEGALDLGPGTRLLRPITFRQLTIFPVVRSANKVDATQYLTLADGLKHKLVTVSEEKHGGQVNEVEVANASYRPLLLIGGEVILGGQQDRVLGQDTIVPPHKQLTVQVFCVEHGRWSGGSEFTKTGGMVDPQVKARAKYNNDQQQVWSKVAEKNAAFGAAPSTGTYRNLAEGAEGERAVRPFRDHFREELAKMPELNRLVGVVAAVDGRVSSVEVFQSSQLFSAYRDRLLDSIFIGVADRKPAASPAPLPSEKEIGDFVKKAKSVSPNKVRQNGLGKSETRDKDGVLSSSLSANGDAQPVYQSYQLAD
jgi:hypothetical protein